MARKCIFCGGSGMTKEHYWPQWLEALHTRPVAGHMHWLSYKPTDEQNLILNESQRPLSALKSTLSRVCGPCNNGWMSRLQTSAKPVLTELFYGRWPKMSRSDFLALARWATMFAMVIEFADPRSVAVSQAQRTDFMNSGRPPHLFKIWMGQFTKYSHNDGGFYHRALVSHRPLTERPAFSNTHSNVFAVGEVLFYVIAAQDNYPTASGDFIDVDVSEWMKLGLRPLWPVTDRDRTRPERLLDDLDYLKLATFFSEAVQSTGFIGITGQPR
jgi:hypothetical protein